jgi:molecular chaperone GrpE
MTSGRRPSARRPAGAPADWRKRQPAGAPGGSQDEDQRGAPEASRPEAPAEKTGGDGALFRDTGHKAPTEAENESAEAVEEDLAALLDDVKRERDEYLELAKRARADFENYRRRAAQQTSDAERKVKASLARDLIPAIDNLERALESAHEDDPLSDGVRLVHRELTEALDRAGVTSFDPTGERFDPASSEALSTQPSDGSEPGTVLEVLTRGYRLGDLIIRPARVVVAQ